MIVFHFTELDNLFVSGLADSRSVESFQLRQNIYMRSLYPDVSSVISYSVVSSKDYPKMSTVLKLA